MRLVTLAASHCLVAEGLSLAAAYHRGAYVRLRELLVLGGQAHHAYVLLRLAQDGGGFTPFWLHGGSPWQLLALMQTAGPLWMLLLTCPLHRHTLLLWSCLALPALAALPVWGSPAVCRQLLQAPGTLRPLGQLFKAAHYAHAPASGQVQPTFSGLDTVDPMQQCLAVYLWSCLLLLVALPLLVLYHTQRSARRRFEATARRVQGPRQEAGRGPAAASVEALEQPEADAPHSLRLPHAWLTEAYGLSCLVWVGVVGVLALLRAA